MKKGLKVLIVIILLAILGGVGFYGYTQFKGKTPVEKKKEKAIKEIKDYDYKLDSDASKRYKELFNILLKELSKKNKEEIDEELYAKTIAEMFALDFYDLNSKKSKNDIGGVQFVHTKGQSNFILEASDTMYKYIEHNLYGNRTQKLPEVESVIIDSITKTTFTYKSAKITDANAYSLKLTINYKEDLSYPKNITMVIMHEDKILQEKTEEQEEVKITKLSIVSVK